MSSVTTVTITAATARPMMVANVDSRASNWPPW